MQSELTKSSLENFNWVLRIIHSCRDTFQIETAKVLIDLYAARYDDATLVTELKIAHKYKYDDIHQILN